MKLILSLLILSTLMGCVSKHDMHMERKKVLCVQFGMGYEEFQFPDMGEADVICRNPETGDYVYMEVIPENKVRPSLY